MPSRVSVLTAAGLGVVGGSLWTQWLLRKDLTRVTASLGQLVCDSWKELQELERFKAVQAFLRRKAKELRSKLIGDKQGTSTTPTTRSLSHAKTTSFQESEVPTRSTLRRTIATSYSKEHLGAEEAEPDVESKKEERKRKREVRRLAMEQRAKDSQSPGSLAPALNRFLTYLWPRIDKYLRNLLTGSVQDSINASLPSLVTAAGGVKFTEVKLGDTTPTLGPIVTHLNQLEGSIELDIGMDISCDLDVHLTAMTIPLGIKGLVLKGNFTCLFTPKLDRPPFFGGIQMYFPNPPKIAIHLSGAARALDIPGLRGAIRGAIDRAVADICVLPRRIAVDMDQEDDQDIVDLRFPQPIGVMRVRLWSGSHLIAADYNFLSEATSDPYVVASLGISSWTSPIIKKDLNPSWTDAKTATFDFPVHDREQLLSLKVYDYDFGKSDDLIGVSEDREVEDLSEHDRQRQTVHLYKTADLEESAGTLDITTTFLTLSHAPPDSPLPEGPSDAHLSARIDTIKGLPKGAEYPFTVKVQVLRQGHVLVEASTTASKPLPRKGLAEEHRQIAEKLAKLDSGKISNEEIADALECELHDIMAFVMAADTSKEENKKLQQEREKAALHSSNIKCPQFNQSLQLLLPTDSVTERAEIHFTILDKKKTAIARAEVLLGKVLEANDLELIGPFNATILQKGIPGDQKIEVLGSLCLRWLSADDPDYIFSIQSTRTTTRNPSRKHL